MAVYRRIVEIIVTVCEKIEVLFLVLMTAMVFSLVISRYVFSYSFAWIEELTRYLMIWAAFLGAAALFKSDGHINMDLFYRKLSERWRTIFDLVFALIQMTFMACLTLLGIQYAESSRLFVVATLSNLSMYWVTLIIPISAALSVIIILFNIIRILYRLFGKKMPVGGNQPEEI